MPEETKALERTKKRYAILFIDIHDSQQIHIEDGPEVYLKVIEDFREISEKLFKKFDPVYEGIQGDGAYALFEEHEFRRGILRSMLMALLYLYEWSRRNIEYPIGISLHYGEAYEYRDRELITTIEGDKIIEGSRLQKFTKELKEFLLFSKAYIKKLLNYPVIDNLVLNDHQIHSKLLNQGKGFDCSGLSNCRIHDIRVLVPILNNLLLSSQEYNYRPSRSWASIYKSLAKENDLSIPGSEQVQALMKIFMDFGFEILAGKKVHDQIDIPFILRSKKHDRIFYVYINETFGYPNTNIDILQRFIQNDIKNVVFIVNDLGLLNEKNENEFFPADLDICFTVFDVTELASTHALKRNIPEIEEDLVNRVFFDENRKNISRIVTVRSSLLNSALQKKLGQFKEIQSEYSKLRTLLRSEKMGIGQVAKEISCNHPILSSEVLKIHNSAATPAAPTQNIENAVKNLGARKVESIIDVEHAKKIIQNNKNNYFFGFGIMKDDYLRHCRLSGYFCSLMADRIGLKLKYEHNNKTYILDNFYSLGFLHDIGISFLDQSVHRYYRDIILGGRRDFFTSYDNEIKYGVNHAHWSHIILGHSTLDDGTKTWILPIPVVNGIYHHHAPFEIPRNSKKETKLIACLLYISERMTEGYRPIYTDSAEKVSADFSKSMNIIGTDFATIVSVFEQAEEMCDQSWG